MVLPHVLKATFGVVAPESKHYIDYLYGESAVFAFVGVASNVFRLIVEMS